MIRSFQGVRSGAKSVPALVLPDKGKVTNVTKKAGVGIEHTTSKCYRVIMNKSRLFSTLVRAAAVYQYDGGRVGC